MTSLSRRSLLAFLTASTLAGCSDTGPPVRSDPASAAGSTVGDGITRWTYGDDLAQYADLYHPATPSKPGVVVVIHGGFWRSFYDAQLGAPLCADLAGRGYCAWNLEYRRVGNGGGWPTTFADVAAGIDLLATVPDLDLSSVVTIGHSAGGHLAVWAAGRQLLPAGAPGAGPRVPVTGAISQGGVLNLGTAATTEVGGSAVPDLLGGLPDQVPSTYALADPIARVPIGVRVRAAHSRDDDIVPFDQSESYVAAAVAAGDDAVLIDVPGSHMDMIDAQSPAWAAVLDALDELSR